MDRHEYLLDGADGHGLGIDRPRVRFAHLALLGEESTLCGLSRIGLRQVNNPGAVPCRRCEKERDSSTAD